MTKLEKTILSLLKENARVTVEDIAHATSESIKNVSKTIDALMQSQHILGFVTVTDANKEDASVIKAIIELSVRPEKKSGYDSLAAHISEHDYVKSLHLVSGQYDFLVIMEAPTLHDVSSVVSDLASLSNVSKTATHVILKTYKELGLKTQPKSHKNRLAISV